MKVRYFRVPSESAQKRGLAPDASEYYHQLKLVVIVGNRQLLSCSCKGYLNQHHCYHQDKVRAYLEERGELIVYAASVVPQPASWSMPQDNNPFVIIPDLDELLKGV